MTGPLRRAAVLGAMLLLGVGAADAAVTERTTSQGAGETITLAQPPPARLTAAAATETARTSRRLQSWLDDHPSIRTTSQFDDEKRLWTVGFLDATEKLQAQVLVDDNRNAVTETRTGPQVAWQMARGYKGAFGRSITNPEIWWSLLAVFLIPFLGRRQLVSWRTLDLLMLGAFSASLVWFNKGEVFTSVPLAYPPLVYLFARMLWIGLRGQRAHPDDAVPPADRPYRRAPQIRSWCPTWLLVSLMFVALGLRLGLNAFDSNVIDVGYAGVIGADRITHGITPYGTSPSDCSLCDTYGPANYLAYVPFELAMPWVGKWNDLPAAHGAAVMFDLVALLGMIALGFRFGGRRLAAGLGFAWAAFPFTAYALESNSNDSLVAACLVWGLVVAHRPMARGVMVGLAALSKFTPAILLLLWSRHPFPRPTPPRHRIPRYLAGLSVATVATSWVVFLDGWDGLKVFWERTLGYQFGRESPFSAWGQYTWLRPVQLAIAAAVAVLAVGLAVRPRVMDVRSFAALSGALLLGVQLTMTHWFYLYIPWFVPFAFLVLIPHWPDRIPLPIPAHPEHRSTDEVAPTAPAVA